MRKSRKIQGSSRSIPSASDLNDPPSLYVCRSCAGREFKRPFKQTVHINYLHKLSRQTFYTSSPHTYGNPMISRRQFVKLTAVSAAIPIFSQINLVPSASAAALGKVPTDDPAAVALKYVEIATTANRTDKMGVARSEQICGNCRFYKDSEEPGWGGCTLFENRLVTKGCWCVGWVPVA